MAIRSSLSKISRRKKVAIIAALILIVFYAISGFLIAPPIVKSIMISQIDEQIGREASIEQIRVNPFVLSATIRGFELKEPDGERFVGFEELYVNFQLSSIFRWAFTFKDIHLVAPDGQIKVLPDGSLNFSDIIAKLNQAEPASDESTSIPPVFIVRLQIEEGRINITDQSLPTPYEETFYPIQVNLENFTTIKESGSPYAFTAATGKGGKLTWEGDFSVSPLRSQGRFVLTGIQMRRLWDYIKDQVNFEITGGSIGLASRYLMEIRDDAIHVELMEGELKLDEFTLAEKGKDLTIISVPNTLVQGIEVDPSNRRVQVGKVHSTGARLVSWLDRKGFLYSEQVFVFSLDDLGKKGGYLFEMTKQAETEKEPWQITVNEVTIDDYGMEAEDRTLSKPFEIDLVPIKATLKNLSTQKDSKAEVLVGATLAKQTAIEVKGTIGINPISADLTVHGTGWDLRRYQPYLDSVAQLELVSGTANMDGRLQYNPPGGKGPELSYQADVEVDGFRAVDRLRSEDFAKLESLRVNGLVFDFKPNNLRVPEIIIRKPYANVTIWSDGKVNAVEIFSAQKDESGKEGQSLLDRIAQFLNTKIQEPVPIRIDSVKIENGSADFTDLLIAKFAANVRGLNGAVNGLSSKEEERADVLLESKVDQSAPVKISGKINPLSEEIFADVKVSFKNYDLTKTTPYAGKFLGYKIEEGRLSLDVKYKLSDQELVGQNEIVLYQLKLGERVESPDAIKAPVSLGVALLKDGDGNIQLNVPVEGNLEDPNFDYETVVADAMASVMKNIVSSPFAALGSLVGGGGEELSYVEFEFGSAELETDQMMKLEKLAEALKQRPSLQLEVKGTIDKKHDRLALAEADLMNQIKKDKQWEMRVAGKRVSGKAEDISLSDEDYRRLVKSL